MLIHWANEKVTPKLSDIEKGPGSTPPIRQFNKIPVFGTEPC